MHPQLLHSRKLLAASLPLALFATAALAANLGIVHGTVVDVSGRPLASVDVSLQRDGHPVDRHPTDAQGHFEFEQVPFGNYQIVARDPGGRSRTQDIRISSGDVLAVRLSIAEAEEEIHVTARKPKAPPPARQPSSVSTVEHQDVQNLPRGDTQSVNEILSTQPGFVYDAFGNLFARGNHANIQYQIDGVPLPDSVSGLFGGFLSPKLVENMEVLTGGLSAEYGERLSAVVNLNSRRAAEEGTGEVELVGGSDQTFAPSALYGKRFGALSVFAGGSYRTTQRALDPQVLGDTSHAGGDEERAFLRVDADLDPHTHLSLLGSFAHNFYRIPVDISVPPYDASKPNGGRVPDSFGNQPSQYFPSGTDQHENEKDAFALASLRTDFSPGASFRAAITYRHSTGFLFGDAAHALGPGADPCITDSQNNTTCASTSDVNRTADHLGVNVEQLVRLGDDQVLKAGGQVDQLFGKTGFTSYTRSDSLQAPDPAQTSGGTDTSHATTGGAYVQDRITAGPWVFDAGVRLDAQRVAFVGSPEGSTQVGFGPRLGASVSLSDDTVVHAFGGLLWQPPPVLDTPAAARILGVVSPTQRIPYDLQAEKDRYAEVGIESRVLPQLSLKLTAWGRLSTDQLDDVAVGGTNLVSPYNFRDGRAAGVESGATLVLGRAFSAFANVSLERAQGRGIETAKYLFPADALANPGWQILDHVQTWTGNVGATVRDGQTRLSGLAEYGSGLRTGANNSRTVPDHLRVDLSLSHQFADAFARPTVAIDLVNAFDAHYAYRIGNGFNGSHYAQGRSVYVRLGSSF